MLTIALWLAALAGGAKPAVNITDDRVLEQYGAVACLRVGKPVTGRAQPTTTWSGGISRFAIEVDVRGHIAKANWPDVLNK
jgi:hypothetical protein